MSRLTTEQAADQLGVAPSTLRAAVSRALRDGATREQVGQHPADDVRLTATWDMPTLTAWWASRPGRGRRSAEPPTR